MRCRVFFHSVIILLVAFAVLAATGTIDVFLGGDSLEQLNFSDNPNQTAYISIPRGVLLDNITLQITPSNYTDRAIEFPNDTRYGNDVVFIYHHNLGVGNLTDESVKNITGVVFGDTERLEGKYGNATYLPATAYYRVDPLEIHSNYTLMTWIRVNGTNETTQHIYRDRDSGGAGMEIQFNQPYRDYIQIALTDSHAATAIMTWNASNIRDGSWHHLAFSYGETLDMYYDGVNVNSSAGMGKINTTSVDTFIYIGADRAGGAMGDLGAHYFQGWFDDTVLINNSVNDTFISNVYGTYPHNLDLEIGDPDNIKEWNYTARFIDPINTSINTSIVQDILSAGCNCTSCQLVENNCGIPLLFHSDTTGILELDIINISYSFGLDNCTDYSAVALEFYSFEENNLSGIPVDVDGVFTYTVNSFEFYNYTIAYEDVYNFSICIYPNWSIMLLDTYLQYEASGGIRERYYIDNLSIVNDSSTINLYNFEDITDVSELKANLRTYYYSYYPNVIMQMQRYYPDQNSWLTVQVDQSDEFGTGVFYVYQNEIDYRFNWIEDGTLLDVQENGASTAPLKFVCDSATECESTFVVGRTSVEELYEGMVATLTYNNETDIVLLTWNDADTVVDSVRLIVEQQAANGQLEICDELVESASGSITCNVSGYNGLITARAIRAASPDDPFAFLRIDKTIRELYDALANQGWQNEGTFLAFLVMAVVAGFGATSALASILLGVFGLIILWVLEITTFVNIAFVVTGAAIGLIVAYLVHK